MGDRAHAGPLFPAPAASPGRAALRLGARALRHPELRGAALRVTEEVAGAERVAVWAEPRLETCLAVVGALLAGVPVVPVNPKSGERELDHVARDSAPDAVIAAAGAELPGPLAT